MTNKQREALTALRDDYVQSGCTDYSDRLGFVKMIDGYLLMLNSDETHFFWLRWDGKEGLNCWDMWWVYRCAKLNKLLEQAE